MKYFLSVALLFGLLSIPFQPASAQSDQVEITFWESVKNSKIAPELEAYLTAYPKGKFAPLARIRLNRLIAGGEARKEEEAAPTPSSSSEPVKQQAASGPPPVHECDRLAANPVDPGKVTAGVVWADFVADGAIKACRAALEKYPDTTRFQYQLGRALTKAESYDEALTLLRKAADKDYPASWPNLGVMYQSGWGVTKDEVEAVKWFRKAAEKGNATAMYNLGVKYAIGRGVAKDESEAVNWYRKAAEKGQPNAMTNLGKAYSTGRGVAQDDSEAVKWYLKAEKKGNATAMYNLGVRHDSGKGVVRNPRKAARYLLDAFKKGSKNADFVLLREYERLNVKTRRSVQRLLNDAGLYSGSIDGYFDVATRLAISAFASNSEVLEPEAKSKRSDETPPTKPFAQLSGKGAEAHTQCRQRLGPGGIAQEDLDFGEVSYVCTCASPYQWNEGNSRCIKGSLSGQSGQAAEPTKKIARRESDTTAAPNQQTAKQLFDKALKAEQRGNYSEAAVRYKKLVEKDSIGAIINLGLMYRNGKGVSKRPKEAFRLFRRGADLGHPYAMYLLAGRYRRGIGIKQDDAEAARLYREALDNGYIRGAVVLGLLYDTGSGVQRDSKRGAKLVARALKAGDKFALDFLKDRPGSWSKPFWREFQRIMKNEGVYGGAIDGSFGPATKRGIISLARQ